MMGFGFLGLLLLLVIGGLVVAGIPAIGRLFTYNTNRFPDADSARNALEILDQRYAHGEITREEYKQAKEDLGG